MSFNRRTAAALTGLTPRQIGYWDRTHIVSPSLKDSAGYGSGRFYSFVDLVLLKAAELFKDRGVSLQKTGMVIRYLKKHCPDREKPVTGLQFITDGDAIFVLSKDNKIILKTLAKGQMIFAVSLGRIIEDLKCETENACRERSHTVSVRRKAYEVVLHPDTEDGGFCVACPSLHGCDSQGDTEEDALEMIKDAIKGHLAVAAKKRKKRATA